MFCNKFLSRGSDIMLSKCSIHAIWCKFNNNPSILTSSTLGCKNHEDAKYVGAWSWSTTFQKDISELSRYYVSSSFTCSLCFFHKEHGRGGATECLFINLSQIYMSTGEAVLWLGGIQYQKKCIWLCPIPLNWSWGTQSFAILGLGWMDVCMCVCVCGGGCNCKYLQTRTQTSKWAGKPWTLLQLWMSTGSCSTQEIANSIKTCLKMSPHLERYNSRWIVSVGSGEVVEVHVVCRLISGVCSWLDRIKSESKWGPLSFGKSVCVCEN